MAEKNIQMEQAQEQAGGMKPEKKQNGQKPAGKSRVGLCGQPELWKNNPV